MKKQIFSMTLAALFGIGAAIAAPQTQEQAPPPPNGQSVASHQPDPNRQVQRLAKRLNLSEDQQSQILPILSDQQQQMENIRSDSSLSPKDRHAKMRTVREDSEAKIKSVLTDSQKQAYDAMLQRMHERAEQHRQERQNSTQGAVI